MAASFTVLNTGTRPDAEVAQLYVADPAATGEPPTQLKGYQKVFLQPRHRIDHTLMSRAFAYWATATSRRMIAAGTYRIPVTCSPRAIRLCGQIQERAGAARG